MDTAKYAALFRTESREHLDACSRLLLTWEQAPEKTEPVDELFRSVHTVKGMAATMGYVRVSELAHGLETVLSAVRAKDVAPSADLVQRLIRGVDALERAVGDAASGNGKPGTREGGKAGGVETAAEPAPAGPAVPVTEATVRVGRDRLDRLVRMSSELVVARTRLAAAAARHGDAALTDASQRIGRLARDLHEETLAVRLVPAAEIFDRFPRLVRDLSKDLDKRVRLETSGGELELDRAVLDAIAEPLVHLLRNAIDHGIESADERRTLGKPAEGRIALRATRDRETVTIRVTDDGRGVDRARVLIKAKRLKVAVPDGEFDDAALFAVIARPGFSTAEKVSDVSGRGVGVDAVVTAVRRLRGSVALETVEGKGTTWFLRVPATLSVVRALLASAGGERVAIPFDYVAEALLVPPAQLGPDATEVPVRGESLPLRDLATLVGRPSRATKGRGRPVLVLAAGGKRSALAVDALLGQMEIVVERFDAPAGLPAYIGGATILADGAPALVLDAAAIA